jgi:cell division protein FtsZ
VAPASVNASIESAAKAAIAAAAEDVSIRPLTLKPSLFIEQPATSEAKEEPQEFIPPAPERMAGRGPRMPRIDELPVPAQNEIRARRGELPPTEHPGRRKSLLERIASVGLGRREQAKEEDDAPAQRPGPIMPQSLERLAGRPMPRSSEQRPEPVSEYAKRAAPQGLDQHGRQTPVHNHGDEDQLEIPAFLRRQAQ